MKIIFLCVSILALSNSLIFAADTYAAIAFSESTGVFGKTSQRPDRATAEEKAIANCGEWDCKAVVWVKNACAALAVGSGFAYGWAWDETLANAEMRAMAECGARTGDCAVVTTVCSYN